MRILFIDFNLPYLLRDSDFPAGGWATQLTTWIAGLSEIGHSVGVLTWKGANAYVGAPRECELIETYDPAEGIRVAKYPLSYIPSLLAAARRFGPDTLIQANAGLNTGIMAFIAQRLGKPFIYRVSNDIDVDSRIAMHLRAYERFAYRYGLRGAASILCQNDYQFSALRRSFPQKPLQILHNPFRMPVPLPAIRPRSARSYVAWLAVFRPFKNLALLYRLASSLPNVEFRVAGKPDSEIDRATAETIELLRALRNVTLVGYVRPSLVPDFLSRAVMLLSTSNYEGFSNTFLESFAAGTPVVTRAAVDPDGIVERNNLGISAADETRLQDGVRALWAMEDAQFGQVASRCRTYVATNHAPTAKAAKLVSILEAFINRDR